MVAAAGFEPVGGNRMKSPGMLFIFSGLTFLLVGIATGNFAVFLTIGIALIVIGSGIRQRQKNKADD
ncbi:hypothetical protein ACFLV2_01475 [Chloroflexota bacterium]